MRQEASGRSMVEIIGVLAIAGLLSIGGIVGFRHAMHKNYANELTDEVNKRAYLCSSTLSIDPKNTDIQKSFEPTAVTTPGVNYALNLYGDFFGIVASNIEENTCKHVLGMEYKVPYAVVGECPGEAANNKIAFYFNNDMGPCLDSQNCIVPEVCEDETKQCGYTCCGDSEHCVEKKCCPAHKYIAATNICCEGDEIAYDTTGHGDYECKTPEEGDNCLDDGITPNQQKCDRAGDEKLYCKVTAFNGCTPTKATCQPIPAYIPKELKLATSVSMGEWRKSKTTMDWWSAKDFCDSMGMELISRRTLCNHTGGADSNACKNKATATMVSRQLGTAAFNWLDAESDCKAYLVSDAFGISGNSDKKDVRETICAPKNYTEPNPCGEGEYYNVSTDTCGLQCEDYHICQEKKGANYYCKMNTSTVNSSCSNTPIGICTQRDVTIKELKLANSVSMGEWRKSKTTMDWWSAKDFCDSMGMELISRRTLCNHTGGADSNACKNKATATMVSRQLGTAAFNWLDAESDCKAYLVSDAFGISGNSDKKDVRETICAPKNYTEPNPICPDGGYYNVSSNTCVAN